MAPGKTPGALSVVGEEVEKKKKKRQHCPQWKKSSLFLAGLKEGHAGDMPIPRSDHKIRMNGLKLHDDD